MTHIGVNSVGYRIEAGGAVLAYTGDSGPCEEVVEMARDADLFVAEATYQDASSQAFFHLSADAGGPARDRARARSGWCSRTSCRRSTREVSRDEAAMARSTA